MTLSIWNGNFMFSYDLEERPTQTEDSSWGRADLSSDTHTRPGQKQPRDVGAEGSSLLSFLGQAGLSTSLDLLL